MKLAKMLSLTAVAAIAAMAFVGTSSAVAKDFVVLCKEKKLECPLTQWWGYLPKEKEKEETHDPVSIVGHATNPELKTTIGTVVCEKSLAEISFENLLAKLILGHILELSFESCKLGGTACTVTVSEKGGISITHGVNPLEWIGVAVPLPLIVEGKEVGMNTVANVKCGFLINCTYEGGEETVTTTTNNAEGVATVFANKAELHRTKGFCPETSEWTAKYVSLTAGLWLES